MPKNPLLVGVMIGVGAIIVLGIVFVGGLMIGRRGSDILPPPPVSGGIEDRHGILGTVTDIDLEEKSFGLISAGNEPLTVFVRPSTILRQGKQIGTFKDLSEGASVVVIGSNMQNQYVARMVVIQQRNGPVR